MHPPWLFKSPSNSACFLVSGSGAGGFQSTYPAIVSRLEVGRSFAARMSELENRVRLPRKLVSVNVDSGVEGKLLV